jgi:GrpB-like predicted nucleotidyltransferase (UPF0157 family)
MMPMIIHPPSDYQPLAHRVFNEVRVVLQRALPNARIEHVGSSSVPGAISKGDLDICVSVLATDFKSGLERLQVLGYTIKNDTLRTEQLCMLEASRKDISLAIQLIEKDSEFEFFHKFRDALLANPALVDRYNEMKLKFSSQGSQTYRDEKAKFIRSVLEA